MEGWIKIGRELTEDEMYRGERFDKTHAWIDLLMMANVKPRTISRRGGSVTIGVGEVGISLDSLAERWGWSKHTVIAFLDKLEVHCQIEVRKSHVLNVIRIVNWEKYQDNALPTALPTALPNGAEIALPNSSVNTDDAERFSNVGALPTALPNDTPTALPTKSAQTIPLYKNILSSRNYSTISKGSNIEDSKIIKERNVNVKKEIRGADVPAKDEHSADAKSSPVDKPPVTGRTKCETFAKQVERSTDQSYKAFGKWLLENAPNILDGRTCAIKPPTEEEYAKLRKKLSGKELAAYILQIENNRLYLSKYKSMYLTIMNWVARDGGRQKRIN